MERSKKISSFIVVFMLVVITNVGMYAKGATDTSLFANACSNHGGVNCTIINPDASVTCNDGTNDKSLIIYAITQCQETIDSIVKQQSAFMAKSGCMPPGEMGCTTEQSYKNLADYLTGKKLVDSELGKGELLQCRHQITDFEFKNQSYKQCLVKNNNPNFSLPTNKQVQPILKAIFCPIFYGDNSSYDIGADLCVCDSGHFLSGGKCVDATLLCKAKHGSKAYEKNGNCLIPQSTIAPKPIFSPSSTVVIPIKKPASNQKPAPSSALTPIVLSTTPPTPPLDVPLVAPPRNLEPAIDQATPSPQTPSNDSQVIKKNLLENIVDIFISGIKKLFNLFS